MRPIYRVSTSSLLNILVCFSLGVVPEWHVALHSTSRFTLYVPTCSAAEEAVSSHPGAVGQAQRKGRREMVCFH